MERIHVETYQNADIKYQPAPVAYRLLATLIDLGVMGVYLLLLVYSFDSFSRLFDEPASVLILLSLPVVFYHLIMELLFEGRSVGKMLLKTGVMREDGSRAGFLDYFTRWIFRLVDITITMGTAGLLTIIINGRGQRLGDIAAGTTVVLFKSKPESSLDVFHTSENHEVVFPGAAELSEKDVALIRDALYKYRFGNNNARTHILAKRLLKKAGSEADGQEPTTILKQLLEDYNYLQYNREV